MVPNGPRGLSLTASVPVRLLSEELFRVGTASKAVKQTNIRRGEKRAKSAQENPGGREKRIHARQHRASPQALRVTGAAKSWEAFRTPEASVLSGDEHAVHAA